VGKQDEIRLMAYRIWEDEGRPEGKDNENWFKAEALWEKEHKRSEMAIGSVSEFFARPVVAGVKLTGSMKVGDEIRIKGHTTDLAFKVASVQIDNNSIQEGKPGDKVGIKVPDRVRVGDIVYKISG
jgi:translation elongation factor EF-1alpha